MWGTTPDRRGWRLMGPDARRRDRGAGHRRGRLRLRRRVRLPSHILPIPPDEGDTLEDRIRAGNRVGRVCVGTPEMARAQIQRLLDKSGGFGTYLFMGGDFATPEATRRSWELFAREVAPHFRHQLAAPKASEVRVASGKGPEEVLLAVAKAAAGLRSREGGEVDRSLTSPPARRPVRSRSRWRRTSLMFVGRLLELRRR